MDHVEEDDGVLENWDDAEDLEELERRMDKRVEKQRKQQPRETKTAAQATAAENSIFTRDGQIRQPAIQSSEERTQYTPQIRLLKRPEGQRPDAALAAEAAAEQNRGQTKSLAERQQEYDAARQRIMGKPASPATKKVPHR